LLLLIRRFDTLDTPIILDNASLSHYRVLLLTLSHSPFQLNLDKSLTNVKPEGAQITF